MILDFSYRPVFQDNRNRLGQKTQNRPDVPGEQHSAFNGAHQEPNRLIRIIHFVRLSYFVVDIKNEVNRT